MISITIFVENMENDAGYLPDDSEYSTVGGHDLTTGRDYEINQKTGETEYTTPIMRDGKPLLPETTQEIINGHSAMPLDAASSVHPDTKIRSGVASGVWEGDRPLPNIAKSLIALQNAEGDLYQRYDDQGNPTHKVVKFNDGTEYKYDMNNKALVAKMYNRYNTTPSWDPADAPALYGIGRGVVNAVGNGVNMAAKATVGKNLIPNNLMPSLPKILDPTRSSAESFGANLLNKLPESVAKQPIAKATSDLPAALSQSQLDMLVRRNYRTGI